PIPLIALFANDTDADGDVIVLDSFDATSIQGGAITHVGQTLQYVPPAGPDAPDSFAYRISDGFGGFASTTVTIAISSNTPPQLVPVPNGIVGVQSRLVLTNSVSDADEPSNRLTFSLDPGAPPKAYLHPTTGRFIWIPSRAYANTTNRITMRVTDDGLPPLSA